MSKKGGGFSRLLRRLRSCCLRRKLSGAAGDFMRKIDLLATIMMAAVLSACSASGGSRLSSPTYVWARNDGQRMSTNPVLLKQGQTDQIACRESASVTGELNVNNFSACMAARGYRPVYADGTPIEVMTPAETTARMQAAAAMMNASRLPVYQPAPVYQMPTYQPLQTTCMTNGSMTNCTSSRGITY